VLHLQYIPVNELEIAAGQRMEPVSYPGTPVPII
jgi:hypothetical protein